MLDWNFLSEYLFVKTQVSKLTYSSMDVIMTWVMCMYLCKGELWRELRLNAHIYSFKHGTIASNGSFT